MNENIPTETTDASANQPGASFYERKPLTPDADLQRVAEAFIAEVFGAHREPRYTCAFFIFRENAPEETFARPLSIEMSRERIRYSEDGCRQSQPAPDAEQDAA